MKKKTGFIKNFILLICVLGALYLGLTLFFKSPLFAVEHITKETHLEIGETLNTDPEFYLDGDDWCVALSYVDTSAVKKSKVGRYPIYIYHGLYKYTCYVNVTDTLAPIVSCDIKNKTITTGETISVHKLGLNIQDHSDIDRVVFSKIASTYFYTDLTGEDLTNISDAYAKGIDLSAEEFQFSYGGIYTLTITVTDTFHNSSDIELTLTVESPPVITAPNHIYITSKQKADFSDYIEAWDFIDKDFGVDDVVVDTSELNLSKDGEYRVYFKATDSYGLSLTAYSIVHVSSQEALQELINTHKINLNKDIVIGAINPHDIGYYEDATISEIQDSMLPTVVHIKNDKLDTFGSGFIIEINDSYVTIATNEHVINSDLIVDVFFNNGLSCTGSVVASHAIDDIAFIRIPITDENSASTLSVESIQSLRTVHINKSYWDSLSNDSSITYSYICIDSDYAIWMRNDGIILEKLAIRDWNDYKDVSETIISTDPVPGSSGSALFDECGRLVGMIRGYTDYETYSETVAVPLDRILKYFETTFKYKIHYH